MAGGGGLHLVSLVVKAIIPRQYLSVRFVLHHPLQLIGFRANGPREFGDGIEMKRRRRRSMPLNPDGRRGKAGGEQAAF
jgi:hypothetical protein